MKRKREREEKEKNGKNKSTRFIITLEEILIFACLHLNQVEKEEKMNIENTTLQLDLLIRRSKSSNNSIFNIHTYRERLILRDRFFLFSSITGDNVTKENAKDKIASR